MDSMVKKSFAAASLTVFFDFLLHYFLTQPMESLTYFVIKFLLAFFAASALFGSGVYKNRIERRWLVVFTAGLIFSALMSVYYRSWELGEAGVPFGSEAPDIMGIARTNLILFSGIWWLGHALFFAAGAWLADLISDRE